MMNKKPLLIKGGHNEDLRGIVSYVNDFDLSEVKRFYSIAHLGTNIVRAWQAHQQEKKWFYVVKGSFKVILVEIDDWVNPSLELPVTTFELNENESNVLYIPGGFANGFKALVPNSKMIVFSNFTIEQSTNDNYRYDQNLWFDWNNEN